jgi:hypothetical protein
MASETDKVQPGTTPELTGQDEATTKVLCDLARRTVMIEFDCEGCGVRVFGFGRTTVPTSHLCATCEWLCEFVPDPVEFWAAYQRMQPERGAGAAAERRDVGTALAQLPPSLEESR